MKLKLKESIFILLSLILVIESYNEGLGSRKDTLSSLDYETKLRYSSFLENDDDDSNDFSIDDVLSDKAPAKKKEDTLDDPFAPKKKKKSMQTSLKNSKTTLKETSKVSENQATKKSKEAKSSSNNIVSNPLDEDDPFGDAFVDPLDGGAVPKDNRGAKNKMPDSSSQAKKKLENPKKSKDKNGSIEDPFGNDEDVPMDLDFDFDNPATPKMKKNSVGKSKLSTSSSVTQPPKNKVNDKSKPKSKTDDFSFDPLGGDEDVPMDLDFAEFNNSNGKKKINSVKSNPSTTIKANTVSSPKINSSLKPSISKSIIKTSNTPPSRAAKKTSVPIKAPSKKKTEIKSLIKKASIPSKSSTSNNPKAKITETQKKIDEFSFKAKPSDQSSMDFEGDFDDPFADPTKKTNPKSKAPDDIPLDIEDPFSDSFEPPPTTPKKNTIPKPKEKVNPLLDRLKKGFNKEKEKKEAEATNELDKIMNKNKNDKTKKSSEVNQNLPKSKKYEKIMKKENEKFNAKSFKENLKLKNTLKKQDVKVVMETKKENSKLTGNASNKLSSNNNEINHLQQRNNLGSSSKDELNVISNYNKSKADNSNELGNLDGFDDDFGFSNKKVKKSLLEKSVHDKSGEDDKAKEEEKRKKEEEKKKKEKEEKEKAARKEKEVEEKRKAEKAEKDKKKKQEEESQKRERENESKAKKAKEEKEESEKKAKTNDIKTDNSSDENTPEIKALIAKTKSSIEKLNKEKIKKTDLKGSLKLESFDMSKITYLSNLISNIQIEINKKTYDNDQLVDTNIKMQKNYDNINNQLLLYQSNLDTLIKEINFITEIKNNIQSQIDKTKDNNANVKDLDDLLHKETKLVKEKQSALESLLSEIKESINGNKSEADKVEKDLTEKTKTLLELNNDFSKMEDKKMKLFDVIKQSFGKLSTEEINFLKLKEEEHGLDLDIANQETKEKLLAMEIEHIKMSNMMEVQKIEELKQEIEKTKTMKVYIQNEIDELQEKLKNFDVESDQKETEYNIKKKELEDRLNNVKQELVNEKTNTHLHEEEFKKIEDDIKNKISYVSVQNANMKGAYNKPEAKELSKVLNKNLRSQEKTIKAAKKMEITKEQVEKVADLLKKHAQQAKHTSKSESKEEKENLTNDLADIIMKFANGQRR